MKILYSQQKAIAADKHWTYTQWSKTRGVNLSKPFTVVKTIEDGYMGPHYVVDRHDEIGTFTFDACVFDIVMDEPLNLDKFL